MNYKKSMLLGIFLLSTHVFCKKEVELVPLKTMETIAQACCLRENTEVDTLAEDRAQKACVSTQIVPASLKQWTILLYIQARNNLAPFAIQNLRALTNVGSAPNAHFIIQWEQPGQKGVFRYALEGHQVVEKYRNLEEDNICKPVDRLTNAFRWTTKHYPSKKIAVFYWNHGLGVIDPVWGNPLRFLTYAYHPNAHQKASIAELTHISNDHHRGLMFDEEAKTYMTTKELVQTAHNMKTIWGRKLDIIGFDACFMSSMCIWYLLKDFAKFGIGSSEIELATGWNYAEIMRYLNLGPTSTKDLAEAIVRTYGQFYHGRTHLYTLSAIDLSNMDKIKKKLDYIAHKLYGYMDIFGDRFQQAVIKARKATLEFANPMFVDFRDFAVQLHRQLSTTPICKTNDAILPSPTLHLAPGLYDETRDIDEIKYFKHKLLKSIKSMESALIAHVASPHLSRSSGFGIYFPCRDFYSAYCSGIWSKVAVWPDFINKFFSTIQKREYAQML